MHGEATLTGTTGDTSDSSASVGAYPTYSVEKTDKGVRVIRAGAPGPKQANDPTLDTSRDEWIEADGTGHGHSTFSYKETYTIDPTPSYEPIPPTTITANRPNVQTFNAVRSGNWIGPFIWQWVPGEDGSTGLTADTIDTHQQEMPYGTMNIEHEYWKGTPSGASQKIITYDITDTFDGVKARAQYHVTLHDEWEIKNLIYQNDQEVIEEWYPFGYWTSNPIYNSQSPPGPIEGKYGISHNSSVTQESSKTVEKGSKGEVEGEFNATKIAPWLEANGITLGVSGTAHIAVASKETTEQVNSQTMTYTVTPPISIPAGQEARPKIEVLARVKKYKVWRFGKSGFISEGVLKITTIDETPFRPIWEIRDINPSGGGGG